MGSISMRREGCVAVVTLDNGENRHNPEFVRAFLGALDAVEADPGASALVVTSSDPKNWSQGIDLSWMLGRLPDPSGPDEIRAFLRSLDTMFERVLTFPLPTIAALTGHTFGDGAILACCFDFRVMRADRGFFCFPEVDVNIPFLPGMLAIVKSAVPEPALTRWILEGRRVTGAELVQAGVASKAVDGADAVLAEAIAYGATFAKGRPIVRALKRGMRSPILEVFRKDDPPAIARLELMAS
jgi:enoyl-CoA hydratase/carnithine racemase